MSLSAPTNFALSFDGYDDIATANQVPGTGSLTVEAWVRPTYAGGGLVIVSANASSGWTIELYNGKIFFWVMTNQGWQYNQSDVNLLVGQWQHIAATYANGNAQTFVNGVAATPTSMGTRIQGPSLRFGGLSSEYSYFTGEMDEVRLSNIARYTTDFVPPTAPFGADANTIGLWHFDEGTGQTAADNSASANHAILGTTSGIENADPAWTTGYPFPGTLPSGAITLGETNILSGDDFGNGNLLVAQAVTLSQDATLQSLSFYVTRNVGRLRLGLYSNANGNPQTLLAQTAEFTPVGGWNTQNVLTPVLLTAGTYWLVYLPESNNLYFRVAETGTGRYSAFSFGALPSAFPSSPQSGTFHFSFYATFVTGSPTPTPTSTPDFPRTGVLDNFNRANGSLGSNWGGRIFNGNTPMEIRSQRAAGVSSTSNSNYWSANTFGPDSEVYAQVPSTSSGADGNFFYVMVRITQPGSTVRGYRLLVEKSGWTDGVLIQRVDNGTPTLLGAAFSQEIADGDSIGLRAEGSLITAYYKAAGGNWVALGNRNDTTYAGAGYIGIGSYQTIVRFDNLGGGTLSGGTPTLTPTPTNTPTPTSTPTPTTPPNSYELIDAAVARGEITIDQAATYKMYALFGVRSEIPTQYINTQPVPGDGTMLFLEAMKDWDQLSPATKNLINDFITPKEYTPTVQSAMSVARTSQSVSTARTPTPAGAKSNATPTASPTRSPAGTKVATTATPTVVRSPRVQSPTLTPFATRTLTSQPTARRVPRPLAPGIYHLRGVVQNTTSQGIAWQTERGTITVSLSSQTKLRANGRALAPQQLSASNFLDGFVRVDASGQILALNLTRLDSPTPTTQPAVPQLQQINTLTASDWTVPIDLAEGIGSWAGAPVIATDGAGNIATVYYAYDPPEGWWSRVKRAGSSQWSAPQYLDFVSDAASNPSLALVDGTQVFLTAEDGTGNLLYASGAWDENGVTWGSPQALSSSGYTYNPHIGTTNWNGQTQIHVMWTRIDDDGNGGSIYLDC